MKEDPIKIIMEDFSNRFMTLHINLLNLMNMVYHKRDGV